MAGLLLKGVSKRYTNGINAVSNFNIELSDGELVVIAGPKEAGKSSLLGMICGLEKPDEGDIVIGSDSVITTPSKQREIAVIFPCHELYPDSTVYENLEFSLRVQRLPEAVRKEKINKTAQAMGLEDILTKRPEELTPKETYQVILARCIIKEPKVILIDEPYPNAPQSEQEIFWQSVIDLNRKFKQTILMATNNPEEALAMKARTAILKNGYIQQVDSVENIYKSPANLYVAQFINHFNLTVVDGSVAEGDNGEIFVAIDKGAVKIPIDADNKKIKAVVGNDVSVGIRHRCLKAEKNSKNGIVGKIDEILHDGNERMGVFKSKLFDAKIYIDDQINEGDSVGLSIDSDAIFVFGRDTGKTIM